MVVDVALLYLYLASVSTSTLKVNILNSHNSLIFQARKLKFA